jgi:hypothetical protein
LPSLERTVLSLLCVALAGVLSGCVDYTKRQDTVTAAAGDAQDWNKTIHIADPWPPYVMNTQITGDGQRVAGVVQRYSAGSPPASPESSTPAGATAPAAK